jgi:hypothetical protein
MPPTDDSPQQAQTLTTQYSLSTEMRRGQWPRATSSGLTPDVPPSQPPVDLSENLTPQEDSSTSEEPEASVEQPPVTLTEPPPSTSGETPM